jgi:hypothetical protein
MSAADPVSKQLYDLLADWHFRNANLVPLGRVDAELYRRVSEVLRDVLVQQNQLLRAGVTDERHYNDLHEARIEIYRELLDETNGKPSHHLLPGLPTVWYHGDRSYSLDGRDSITVSIEQHNFLRAFLDREISLDTKSLKDCGVSNPAKVARDLAEKYPGTIRRPGREKKGQGYRVRVKTNLSTK